MPFAKVVYKNHPKPYTFYTADEKLNRGEKVLFLDKKGYHLGTFEGYVPRPPFLCRPILFSQAEIDERGRSVEQSMIKELDL